MAAQSASHRSADVRVLVGDAYESLDTYRLLSKIVPMTSFSSFHDDVDEALIDDVLFSLTRGKRDERWKENERSVCMI